jgi:uncharacterized protein involved in type VI secretion and phage assembly
MSLDRRLDGLYPGIVTSNQDPLNAGRVKVSFPWLHDAETSNWARLVQPYAGKERGLFFMPEVGDEVLVAFELGDMNQPMVIGGTWNGEDPPAEPGDPDGNNHHKVLETRSGHKLHFDDTPGAEFILLQDSSTNNSVRWDCASNTVSITARTGDIIIKAPTGTITLTAREVLAKATNSAKQTVGGNQTTSVKDQAVERMGNSKTLTASTSLTGKAQMVQLTSSSSFAVSGGSASVEVNDQTSSKTTVSGPTTDTAAKVELEATDVFERAAVRTWTVASMEISATAVTFDASGPVTFSAGAFNCDAGKGELSLLGDSVRTLGGMIMAKGGQLNFNPPKPPPPAV